MSKYKKRPHVVWKCDYHIVWTSGYRIRDYYLKDLLKDMVEQIVLM